MIIVLRKNISRKEELEVLRAIKRLGYKPHIMRGVARTVVGAIGDERKNQSLEALSAMPQVESVTPVQKRHKLVSREAHPVNSSVRAGNVVIGGRKLIVMAGPCSVESEKQVLATATAVKAAGASILRGGAYKPRTSPYEFQGLGEKGLKILAKARKETGLPIITELLSERQATLVADYADILQIGTRNAQNFQLLIAAAKTGRPVLLKRGLSMRIEEWLLAGEYILAHDNPNLLFCERGVRTFDTYTRNTLDLAAIPILKQETHCPVVIDPSQGAGRADLVSGLCKGAVAMGADALLIEVHPNPSAAWSDAAQQLSIDGFARLMTDLQPFIAAAGRE
ncbi:MAG: 3-deoxy-7-phosphoheptulonate synthase [Verrucomicrobia bacterium]|nr:3-deoxy-7-phosphoheptulonate synthase [Verrucomicrobiota bacterium]MBI3868487.1 3-deoxy-7-phosphoheptulonate synthase [Verrucomicrobiota bacterium]